MFEEMNFTRRLLAQIGRALAERGIGTWLPDLPGTGESARPLASIGWPDWRDAARAAAEAVAARTGTAPFSCAFRGGVLLDDAVAARERWRYAAVAGEALLRQLRRTQLVADSEAGVTPTENTMLAGYTLSAAMRAALEAAAPSPVADREIAAAPEEALWRRAEPGEDTALAVRLSANISDWIRACGSR